MCELDRAPLDAIARKPSYGAHRLLQPTNKHYGPACFQKVGKVLTLLFKYTVDSIKHGRNLRNYIYRYPQDHPHRYPHK